MLPLDPGIGHPTYGFLLVSNINHMSIGHRLGVIETQKFLSYH